jgi:hypothetical protein
MSKFVKITIETAIIAVILAVGIYGVKIISTRVMNGSVQKEVEITFETQRSKPELINKIQIGDKISDSKKATEIGDVVDTGEMYLYKMVTRDYETGKYAEVPVEGYYNRLITVKTKASVDERVVMIGETEISVGDTLPLRNEEYVLDGLVLGIKILD